MKSTSSITLSSALLLVSLFLGCAGVKKEEAVRAEADLLAALADDMSVEDGKGEAVKMKVSYGNKSSRMDLLLDVNSQDVFIDFKGNMQAVAAPRKPAPLKRTEPEEEAPEGAEEGAAEAAKSQPWGDEKVAEEPPKKADKKKEEKKKQEVDEWEEVMQLPKTVDLSKQEMREVLQTIRKAQEWFYQKRYAEALDMVDLSMQKQETAEAYALKGSILYMLERKDEAQQAWVKCLKLNPDMPSVAQMLERLKPR